MNVTSKLGFRISRFQICFAVSFMVALAANLAHAAANKQVVPTPLPHAPMGRPYSESRLTIASVEPDEYEAPLLYDPFMNPVPVIQARVNGSEPLSFIVDTGTNAVLLEPWAAEKAGWEGKTPSEIKFDFGSPGKGMVIAINSDALAIKHLDFPSDVIGMRVAGIIGLPILAQVTTRFDFEHKTLAFTFTPHPPLKLSGATCLPLTLQTGGDDGVNGLNLIVQAGDLELTMKLDTGAQNTKLPKSVGPKLGRILTSAVVVQTQGVNGRQDNVAALVPLLRLGRQSLHDVYALLAVQDNPGKALLGMNVLSRFRITLDPRNRQLWIEPNKKGFLTESADVPGVTGVTLIRRSDGKEDALFVSEDPPLTGPSQAANIKPGDQIVSVDGKAVAGLPLPVARRLLNGYAGSEATILLARDGKQVTTTLRRESPFSKKRGGSGLGFTTLPGVTEGLEVVGINPMSPAEDAGLKIGDLITSVNGVAIPKVTTEVLERVGKLLRSPASSGVVLVVKRVGESKARTIKLQPRRE